MAGLKLTYSKVNCQNFPENDPNPPLIGKGRVREGRKGYEDLAPRGKILSTPLKRT